MQVGRRIDALELLGHFLGDALHRRPGGGRPVQRVAADAAQVDEQRFAVGRVASRRLGGRNGFQEGGVHAALIAGRLIDDALLDQPGHRVVPGQRLGDGVGWEGRQHVGIAHAVRHVGVLDPQIAIGFRVGVHVFGGAHPRPQESFDRFGVVLDDLAAEGEHALAELRIDQRRVIRDQDRAALDGRLGQRVRQADGLHRAFHQ